MKPNHYFKIALVLVVFIFLGCQKENALKLEETENTAIPNIKFSEVSITDIPEIASFLDLNTKTKGYTKTGKTKDIFVNTENIIKVIDSLKNTSYALSFTKNNTEANELFNLIVEVDSLGNKAEPIVLKYTCDSESLEQWIHHDYDFNYFKGVVGLYKYTAFFDNSLFAKGDCEEMLKDGDAIPCSEQSVDNTSTSGGGTLGTDATGTSFGNTSSGGGGGCTTTTWWRKCGGSDQNNAHGVYPVCHGDGGGSGWVITINCGGNISNINTFKTTAMGGTTCECPENIVVDAPVNTVSKPVYVLLAKLGDVFTDEEINWISLPSNEGFVKQVNEYLKLNNTPEDKAFVEFAIEVDMLEPDCGRRGNDCVKSIEVMAAGLRKFHGEEGALMAELFESFIADTTFTLPELAEFHAFAKEITNKYNDYMAGEILLAFGEGVLPIFEFVLLETGTTLAIRILQKIPVSWVLRGARLNKVVKTTVELGVKGTQEHVNIIATSGPVTKANEMFLSLTKNAVSTSSSNGVTVANMGNGNFITYRTVSKSGFPATLDFKFPALFGETNRVLKFKSL